jgi:hypothetical protein
MILKNRLENSHASQRLSRPNPPGIRFAFCLDQPKLDFFYQEVDMAAKKRPKGDGPKDWSKKKKK